MKGTFQLAVQQGGAAERAGVLPGSWLLELNGASVRSYSQAQLTRKVCVLLAGAAEWGSGAGNVTEHSCFLSSLSRVAAR